MTRKARPSLDQLLDLAKKHLATNDPESLTLKGHVLVEVALAHLLAARLEAHESDLPEMRFAELSRLSLAGFKGATADRLRSASILLNNLRNELAHSLEAETLDHRMRDIASLGAKGLGLRFKWSVSCELKLNRYRLGVAWIIGNVEGITRHVQQERTSPQATLGPTTD